MIKQISIKTRFGWVSAYEKRGKIFRIKFGKVSKQIKSTVLSNFRKSLIRFFNKESSRISAPHKIEGNLTQKKVWSEFKKIKLGKTNSYGKIAKKFKLSPRHVGKICGQNKLVLLIPCHRVIRSNGNLGGFSSAGGVSLKRSILKFEKN